MQETSFYFDGNFERMLSLDIHCKAWFGSSVRNYFGIYSNCVCVWLKVRVSHPLEQVRETLWHGQQ